MTNGTTGTAGLETTLGEAKPPVVGYHGVFSQLVAEQREVAALIQKLSALKADDERTALWLELRAAWVSHEQAKKQEVYKEIQTYQSLQPFADEYEHTAHTFDNLLSELDSLPFSVDAWKLSFQHLAANVEHNMAKEESLVFPRAQQAMGADKASQLTLPYLSAKRSLLAAAGTGSSAS